jgi:hypothetical protein
MKPPKNFLEYWRWRYRDRATGAMRTTDRWMTAEEAAALDGPERIDGTRVLRHVDENAFDDTGPQVYRAPGEMPDGESSTPGALPAE